MELVERKVVTSVICPWCGTEFETRPGTNCTNCGGTLPVIPTGAGLPDMPPSAPRVLPKGFKYRMLIKDNPALYSGLTLVGVNAFVIKITYGLSPFNISLVFGIFLLVAGFYRAFWRFAVLQHGQTAKGEVIDAGENKGQSMNGKHPYFIRYSYTVEDKMHSGFVNCWDESSTVYKSGDEVWVLYLPKKSGYRSSLWPPIA